MRQHPIDVLDYLPKFLGKDPMFNKTADTCSTEHNRLRLALQDLSDNFFVNTATWALPLYESFLGIKPGDGDSDEFRRQRILFKLQHVDVSTKDFMNSIINLYSVGHIEEVNEEYYFKVYYELLLKTCGNDPIQIHHCLSAGCKGPYVRSSRHALP